MAKLRVTFDVDQTKLFDSLKEFGGDVGKVIPYSLISPLLTGTAGFREMITLALFGIDFKGAETLPEAVAEGAGPCGAEDAKEAGK